MKIETIKNVALEKLAQVMGELQAIGAIVSCSEDENGNYTVYGTYTEI
jgi:hypothetical protein